MARLDTAKSSTLSAIAAGFSCKKPARLNITTAKICISVGNSIKHHAHIFSLHGECPHNHGTLNSIKEGIVDV